MDLGFFEKKGAAKLLLYFLNKEPLRFRDLKKAISREATLSNRIKDLEDLKLIESIPTKDGRRKFFAYQLTAKGIEIAGKLERLTKTY